MSDQLTPCSHCDAEYPEHMMLHTTIGLTCSECIEVVQAAENQYYGAHQSSSSGNNLLVYILILIIINVVLLASGSGFIIY